MTKKTPVSADPIYYCISIYFLSRYQCFMLEFPKIIMLPNLDFCLHLLHSIVFLFVGVFRMQTVKLSAVDWLCEEDNNLISCSL